MKRRLSETRKGGAGREEISSIDAPPPVVSLSTNPKLAAALGGREARSLLLLARNAARRGNAADNDGVVRLLDVVAQRDALFFVFELYVDEAGWAAHQESEHFKKAIPQLLPLLMRRERIPFVPFL